MFEISFVKIVLKNKVFVYVFFLYIYNSIYLFVHIGFPYILVLGRGFWEMKEGKIEKG